MSTEDTTDGRMATYLKNNPRKVGVLFTALVLLSQAGTVAASTSSYPGP